MEMPDVELKWALVNLQVAKIPPPAKKLSLNEAAAQREQKQHKETMTTQAKAVSRPETFSGPKSFEDIMKVLSVRDANPACVRMCNLRCRQRLGCREMTCVLKARLIPTIDGTEGTFQRVC